MRHWRNLRKATAEVSIGLLAEEMTESPAVDGTQPLSDPIRQLIAQKHGGTLTPPQESPADQRAT